AVLLNRTNRPDATRTGPDADAREALTERGFDGGGGPVLPEEGPGFSPAAASVVGGGPYR
ncbi:hypothetical protein ACWDZX_23460, partial [Streptomyces collinus]